MCALTHRQYSPERCNPTRALSGIGSNTEPGVRGRYTVSRGSGTLAGGMLFIPGPTPSPTAGPTVRAAFRFYRSAGGVGAHHPFALADGVITNMLP